MLHQSSNIPSTISAGSIFLELLGIAKCFLRTDDFIPRASDLLSRMIANGGNRAALPEQLKKDFSSLPKCLSKIWYNS